MAQQGDRLNTDLDSKYTSSYFDGSKWYENVKSADGDLATLGKTTDSDATGNGTLVGILKRIRTLFGAGLPTSLSNGNLKTSISEALPSGTNNIGKVDVSTLPSLPTGSNVIGKVEVTNQPTVQTEGAGSGSLYGALAVGTTATLINVSGANLTGRKSVTIVNIDPTNDVFIGFDNLVTADNGIPIKASQERTITLNPLSPISIYAIASVETNLRIIEMK